MNFQRRCFSDDLFFKKCTGFIPARSYMFKGNKRNTRTCEICSKLTIKTPEWRQWRRSGVFIFNFEHISHLVLVFLLLTLNMQLPAGLRHFTLGSGGWKEKGIVKRNICLKGLSFSPPFTDRLNLQVECNLLLNRFFKLCKWYQITQHITFISLSIYYRRSCCNADLMTKIAITKHITLS